VPGAVFAVLVIVSVDEPEAVTVGGAKEALAPAGRPLTLNVTVPEKLFTAFTDAVNDVDAPGTIVCVAGVAVSVKSGAALTTSVTEVFRVSEPLLPVMVSV
jgi:hypothetical protein